MIKEMQIIRLNKMSMKENFPLNVKKDTFLKNAFLPKLMCLFVQCIFGLKCEC